MRLQVFLENILEYSTIVNTNKKYIDTICFELIDHDRIIKSRNSRFFRPDVLAIGFHSIGNIVYGLQITPDKPWKEWPLVHITSQGSCNFLAPDYRYLSPFLIAYYACCSEQYRQSLKNKNETLNSVVENVYGFYGAKELFPTMEKLIHQDVSNDCNEFNENLYLDWVLTLIPTAEHKLFRRELSRMMNDSSYIPDISCKENYGIWYNALLKKVTVRKTKLNIIDELLLLECLVSRHGINSFPRNGKLSHHSQNSWQGIKCMSYLAKKSGDINFKKYSEHIAYIIDAIKLHKTVYTGKEHFEAAAIVDEVEGKAALSFDYLASGAYWAGRNMRKALPLVEQQMFELAERENWEDIVVAMNFMRPS